MQIKNNYKEIIAARDSGLLLEDAYSNLSAWLEASFLPDWALGSINELIDASNWNALNDRFYKNLEFGTGGMRSRTIAKEPTSLEVSESGQPVHAAIGSNMLNDFNVIKATIGLFRYSESYYSNSNEPLSLVIAHDVRYFSQYFAQLAASTWARLGGRAYLFDGPRSTPQLSFSVRQLKATAGVVITASHNPFHDNGYKVYFSDGGQIIAPHDHGIMSSVAQVTLAELPPHYEISSSSVETLSPELDLQYQQCIEDSLLNKEAIKRNAIKVVFSSVHGTGHIATIPVLEKLGASVVAVKDQMHPDPAFSTVKSPNPESHEAFTHALELAKNCQPDAAFATDPDADRMGVAIPDDSGEYQLISGNIIGSLLAEYRIKQLKASGEIPEEGSSSAALIKTFVTTPLQEAIAEKHGVKLINTLTGFKWIGGKLHDYERELLSDYHKESGKELDYNALSPPERRELLLKHSTYYIFGGEESYGYLANDRVRDKDANEAIIQFCEMIAYYKESNMSIYDAINALYLEYGYYQEDLLSIVFEGATGATCIQKILKSYESNPPKEILGVPVQSITNFSKDTIVDADGKRIPSQSFFLFKLQNNSQFAVRASGTEPKIKFYLFAKEPINDLNDITKARHAASSNLNSLKDFLDSDARQRSQ